MQLKFGTYTGNGSTQSITGVGFQPDLVLVCSINGQSDCLFKTSLMSSTVSLGLRQDNAQLTNGITAIGSDGFSVGSNSWGNNSGSTFVYMAVRDNSAGDFKVFTYTGNGSNNRTVTGFGFQPTGLFVKSDLALTGCFRMSASGSDSTSVFYTDQNQTNLVKTLDADGMTLGTSNIVNQNSIVYHGFAFKKVDGRAFSFSYTGDGNDSRNIVYPGFKLGFAIVKSRATSDEHVFRTMSHSGDNSQPFTGQQVANKIQSFVGNQGFQVGTSASVNTNAVVYDVFCLYDPTQTLAPTITPSYTQPPLPTRTAGWHFNSIDIQIVTKSASWNQDQTKRLNEYQAIKDLGINYVAVAVPYNDTTKYANYIADARTKSLKVWFRSHWNEWEGDNSTAAGQSRQDYLDRTYRFIIDNASLFANGDMFTMSVECNNANDAADNKAYPFRANNLSGGAFTYSQYNQFLKDQVAYANAAFTAIGKTVYTFAGSLSLSLLNLNGQVLDSGEAGSSSGLGDSDIVTYFGGILCIDHYLSNSYRQNQGYGAKLSSDLDKIHTAFPHCLLFIGEWGVHTTVAIGDTEQFNIYREVIDVLKSKPYIIGVNFWVHMASTTASLFADSGGTITVPGRPATQLVKEAFQRTVTRTRIT